MTVDHVADRTSAELGRDPGSVTKRWRRSVWAVAAVVACLEVVANLVALGLDGPSDEEVLVETFGPGGSQMFRYMQFEMHIDALIFVSAVVVGGLILSRYPRHGFGWVFGLGWGVVLTFLHVSMVGSAFVAINSSVLVPTWLLWVMGVLEAVTLITIPLALVIYPTGRSIGLWWSRILRVFVLLGSGLVALGAFQSGPMDAGLGQTIVENPVGFIGFSVDVLFTVFELAFLLFMVVALIVRYVRAEGVERQQMKWVLAIATAAVLLLTISGFVEEAYPATADTLSIVSGVLGALSAVAIGMAILRYRLYDIDVVLSRSLTFGALAAFITVVYALVVVGVGSLFGSDDEPSVGLSIAAVAIVAIAFEPLRKRVQHWANVLVYGKRATPYEVLAKATSRVANTADPDDALAETAKLIVDGTGAEVAIVWLRVGDTMHPRASAPLEAVRELDSVEGGLAIDEIVADRVVAVRHQGDVLGALSIVKSRDDAISASDESVLEDVAAGAGVLLRNMRLNAELAERAVKLRASRRRLVAAHDGERRRLERNLHDGAQQQVVALKVKLGIARTLAEREGAEPVAELVSSIAGTTQEAVDEMRAVAHGIYPPLLDAEGLGAALGAAGRTAGIPVEVSTDGTGRFERSVEESIYFCVLGLLTDAIDAGATRGAVALHHDDGAVRFSVDVDAGLDDLVVVEDRVEALDGTLTATRDAAKTTVVGDLPSRKAAREDS